MSNAESNNIRINIPQDVDRILKAFNRTGFAIFVVGGCVRDSLLKREINDWDLCTKATPEQIVDVCNSNGFKYVPTGLKHGTITVIIGDAGYEVTTFRIDGDYSDNRHPDKVEFTSSLKEDLARRDFTINAMAYNDEAGLIDYFGGIFDLSNKVIRCVGDPAERFTEDALRMLRAIRFSAQLGFKIDRHTLAKITDLNSNINNISQERIREELCKILISDSSRDGFIHLAQTKLLYSILPELNECISFEQHNVHHDEDVFTHILSVIDNVPCDLELKLAALLHDIAKPKCFSLDENNKGHFYEHAKLSADMSREILSRLKFDNKTIDTVCKLVYEHMTPTDLNDKSIKKLIQRVGEDNIYKLIELIIADRMAMCKEYIAYGDVEILRSKIDKILYEKQPISVKDLKINGKDLIQLGFSQGKQMGDILNYLLEMVLENPEINEKDILLGIVKNTT